MPRLKQPSCRVVFALAAVSFIQHNCVASDRPKRIVIKEKGFSVEFPAGWYIFAAPDSPVLFNFPAEDMQPRGEFPKNGASIEFLTSPGVDRRPTIEALTVWADQIIRMYHGEGEERIEAHGPPGGGDSHAIKGWVGQALTLLHEFEHSPAGGNAPQETPANRQQYNLDIYNNCIK